MAENKNDRKYGTLNTDVQVDFDASIAEVKNMSKSQYENKIDNTIPDTKNTSSKRLSSKHSAQGITEQIQEPERSTAAEDAALQMLKTSKQGIVKNRIQQYEQKMTGNNITDTPKQSYPSVKPEDTKTRVGNVKSKVQQYEQKIASNNKADIQKQSAASSVERQDTIIRITEKEVNNKASQNISKLNSKAKNMEQPHIRDKELLNEDSVKSHVYNNKTNDKFNLFNSQTFNNTSSFQQQDGKQNGVQKRLTEDIIRSLGDSNKVAGAKKTPPLPPPRAPTTRLSNSDATVNTKRVANTATSLPEQQSSLGVPKKLTPTFTLSQEKKASIDLTSQSIPSNKDKSNINNNSINTQNDFKSGALSSKDRSVSSEPVAHDTYYTNNGKTNINFGLFNSRDPQTPNNTSSFKQQDGKQNIVKKQSIEEMIRSLGGSNNAVGAKKTPPLPPPRASTTRLSNSDAVVTSNTKRSASAFTSMPEQSLVSGISDEKLMPTSGQVTQSNTNIASQGVLPDKGKSNSYSSSINAQNSSKYNTSNPSESIARDTYSTNKNSRNSKSNYAQVQRPQTSPPPPPGKPTTQFSNRDAKLTQKARGVSLTEEPSFSSSVVSPSPSNEELSNKASDKMIASGMGSDPILQAFQALQQLLHEILGADQKYQEWQQQNPDKTPHDFQQDTRLVKSLSDETKKLLEDICADGTANILGSYKNNQYALSNSLASQFQDLSWHDSDENKGQAVNNVFSGMISTTQKVNISFDVNGNTQHVSKLRNINIPTSLDVGSEASSAALVLLDKNGNRPPESKALYFTTHYGGQENGQPKLIDITYPKPLHFCSDIPDSPCYVIQGNEAYFLPVNRQELQNLLKAVDLNKGHEKEILAQDKVIFSSPPAQDKVISYSNQSQDLITSDSLPENNKVNKNIDNKDVNFSRNLIDFDDTDKNSVHLSNSSEKKTSHASSLYNRNVNEIMKIFENPKSTTRVKAPPVPPVNKGSYSRKHKKDPPAR